MELSKDKKAEDISNDYYKTAFKYFICRDYTNSKN